MGKMRLILLCLLLGAGGGFVAAQPAGGEVRNVIYLIGDGMGLAQVSAFEIEGGYAPTAFCRAQSVALVATRSANNRVTDSAAAGTALATGHKTDNSVLGLDPAGRRLESVMARAAARGMATGIAVTCFLQHATPAAFYAHVGDRNEYAAITRDLLASGIDVLIGGGRKWLAEACDTGESYLDAFGRCGYCVAGSLAAADTVHSGRLLVVAAEEHLPQAPARGDFLPQAVAKSLEVLANDAAERGTGFLLMVEGSQIDMACHDNDTERMLAEMRDFEGAVSAAMDFADRVPGTLVVVAADHETGGLSMPSGETDFTRSESGIDYRYGTKSHSGIRVPAYFYGAGAGRFGGMMDNTELAQRIAAVLGL